MAVLLYDNVDMQQGSSAMLTDITTMTEDTDSQVNRLITCTCWYCYSHYMYRSVLFCILLCFKITT